MQFLLENPILIFCLFLLFPAAVFLANRRRKFYDDETFTQYRAGTASSLYERKLLLSKAEYYFWRRLKTRCDEHGVLICPKVRMEDFVNVKSSDYKLRQRYRGYIKARHVDFLLCDSGLNILAGVELDDASHDKKNAKQVDTLKNDVFASLNIPLYRVSASTRTQDAQLDAIFTELFGAEGCNQDGESGSQ